MNCASRKTCFTLATFFALAFPAVALASDSYKVSSTLSHSGEAFASPTAIVRADQEASIVVSGDNGYEFTFTVTDLAPDQIKVAAKVTSDHGSMDPTVVVRPDTPATVSVGELQLEITVSRSGG
jgi:hypothetical protein